MKRAEVDNRGIPPLAGICTYEEACRTGFSVDQTVTLLKRYNFVTSSLNRIAAAHLPRTPEWEVKSALSLHLWLDAEHSTLFRNRVKEMREPPHRLDMPPDDQLAAWVDELIRAEDTLELLTGLYAVTRPALAGALAEHLEAANPLADHPTCRILKQVIGEQKEMIAWGAQAVEALCTTEERRMAAGSWERHLRAYLNAAGGVSGEASAPADHVLPEPRSDGSAYQMDPMPRRDDRITSSFDQSFSGEVSGSLGEGLSPDERAFVLLHRRLQEMDVPEWMAPIIYRTHNKPWAYYGDMSRQLWDEARHAMMGETGLYAYGVPFYKYPIALEGPMTLNVAFEPLESHVLLWEVEQRLMQRETGKPFELDMAASSGDPLLVMFQDFDWADEVLHAQIGRRWLLPEFESYPQLKETAGALRARWHAAMADLKEESKPVAWWPEFLAEVRGKRTPDIDEAEK